MELSEQGPEGNEGKRQAAFQALFNEGYNSFIIQDYEQAVACFDKALSLNPEHDRAWFSRGSALANLGRYAEASESFEEAIKLNDEDYQPWAGRGLSLAHLGLYAKAVESFNRAFKLRLGDDELKPGDGELWYSRGTALAHLSRYAEALEDFNKATDINPEDDSAWSNRGLSLANMGRYAEAIESYDKAIAIDPCCDSAWSNRGLSLASLGRPAEAIESYDRSIEISDSNYRVWFNRGLSLYELHRYAEAVESYNKVIELNAQYYPAWQNRAGAICKISTRQLDVSNLLSWVRGRSIAASLDQPEPHIAALEEALPRLGERTTSWAHIHLILGDIYMKHARSKLDASSFWHNAVRSYETAYPVLAGQDHLSVLQGLVRAYFSLKDFPSARKFQREGQALFEDLLSAQPEHQKDTFARKFVSFSQLEIDLLISEQKPTSALEQAEFYKNRCLTWMLDGWAKSPTSPTYTDFQALTAPHTAIVYWHFSLEHLTTFIITHRSNEPEILSVNRQQQAQQLRKWLGNYDSKYRSYAGKKPKAIQKLEDHPWRLSLTSQITKLKEILNIDAICQQLPSTVQTLILVPHRDLHRLPLHILFPPEVTCAFYPSLKIGLQLQSTAFTNNFTPLLSVDDPQTEQSVMPFARIESAVIQRITGRAQTLHGAEASVQTVSKELQKEYKSFHFTGHGAYNPFKPADSAIALTDGVLNAKQIGQLDLNSYQLVCLAACETALTGKDGIPDEYVGLASAFLKAGATNVLSTLWPVDEVASAWIMIRFYQNLLAGRAPAVALKSAQQWLRTVSRTDLVNWIMQLAQLENLPTLVQERLAARAKNIAEPEGTMEPKQPLEYNHPYYWAAFTLTGKG